MRVATVESTTLLTVSYDEARALLQLEFCGRAVPAEKIHEVLEQTRRASVRERDLPAHVVVYYVIALALLEGVQWLLDLLAII